MNRHSSISVRISEHVTGASANVSEKDIRKWFSDIYKYLDDYNLSDILNELDFLLHNNNYYILNYGNNS